MDDALPTYGIEEGYMRATYKMQVRINDLELRVAELEREGLKRKCEAEMDMKERAIEEMKIKHKATLGTIDEMIHNARINDGKYY